MKNSGTLTPPAHGVARRQFLKGAAIGAAAFAAPGLVRPAAAADSSTCRHGRPLSMW
ncbi:twin-arginine translocation signal domain-containing protein [Rhodopseudomonas sp. P2A-2r]|uniref:twin-arginine translocation signal domain-containing protein n=1 Tax=Rhodopseudomonas sp. P2A-2r TaxID=2991972 RepID=UPI0039B6EA5C